jgi:hypothetical protein
MIELKSFKIEKFQRLMNTYSTEYQFEIDRNIDRISIIKDLSIEDIEKLSLFEYANLSSEVESLSIEEMPKDLITEFEHDGIKYTTFITDINYTLKIKEVFLINKYINEHSSSFLKYVAAILFREDHKKMDIQDIETRANIFNENMPMEILAPYLNILSINLFDELSALENGITQ